MGIEERIPPALIVEQRANRALQPFSFSTFGTSRRYRSLLGVFYLLDRNDRR